MATDALSEAIALIKTGKKAEAQKLIEQQVEEAIMDSPARR
jgi:hypothetical protein